MSFFSRKPRARICGTGSYVPKKILSNSDLEKMVETNDEWIVSRTGMKERRIAREDEFASDMGFEAALKALESAHIEPQEIDLILFATCTPDYIFPNTASLIQARIKASNAAALDIQAACTGYLYGLSIAKAFIEAGIYQNILLIAAEKLSTIVNYQDRNTCVLFGDGAAAAVICSKGKGLTVRNVALGADGEQAEILVLPAGGSRNPATADTVASGLHYLRMEGKEVYKHAVRRMEMACKESIDQSGFKERDISWLIPHQANIRIIESLAKRFHIPMEKVFVTIHKYGNTSASSIGIALDELVRKQELVRKDKVLLTAFGAGLTWGASVLSCEEINA